MAKRTRPAAAARPIHNLIAISDTHCGCQLALCPPEGVALDNGGVYHPSAFQLKLWRLWREFWDKWVPQATGGEPFAVVHLGDAIDGVHHNATTQISHNLNDQSLIALRLLAPVVRACRGHYYHLRGTAAHVGGDAAQEEERLARELGALPSAEGRYARYELWKKIGPRLVHAMHHIGVTGSQAYESTAAHKEYVEGLIEAGRWGRPFADVVLRGHRHRHIETTIPTTNGEGRSVVLPGWQGKTGFLYRVAGARQSEPQFGGVLIRWSPKNEELFVRAKVWSLERGEAE